MVGNNIYYNDYVLGYIGLSDIPYKYWDSSVESYALKKEPGIYYEKLLEYTINNETGMTIEECLKKIPKEFRTLRIYQKLLTLDYMRFYPLVPINMRSKIKLNPETVKDLISTFKFIPDEMRSPALYKELSKKSLDDYLMYVVDYPGIPDVYRTKEMCLGLFYANIDEYISLIPNEYKSIELCEMLVKRDFKKYFSKVPVELRTVKMYEDLVELDPVNNIDMVPADKRSQKMYDMLFDYGLDIYIDKIPDDFRTKKMYHRLIWINPSKYACMCPKEYFDCEMADYLLSSNIKYLDIIPNNFKDEKFYLELIKKDPIKYLKYLPNKYYTDEVIDSIGKILSGKTIKYRLNGGDKLNKKILKRYPSLIEMFTLPVMHGLIKEELAKMIKENGDISDIATKYSISNKTILNIIYAIEKNDQVFYNNICNYLNSDVIAIRNQTIKDDLRKLEIIILSLGKVTRHTLTLENKLQIAYLTKKYLNYSLEEIYAFNNSSKNDKVSREVNIFIEYVLDYTLYADTYRGTIDVKKISYNNEWLKDFNIVKFFNIVNGNINSKYLYGPNEEELTIDIVNEIISRLKFEEIPLNLLILSVAFRKYFKSELDNYIRELHSFDSIFDEPKRKKR